MIKAAIDIGTNTAHILIAEVQNSRITKILDKRRFYIYLAEDGIERICLSAQNRLYRAMDQFELLIKKYNISKVFCTGTAALRTATNGPLIVNRIKFTNQIEVHLITGEQEAEYIFNGVIQKFNSIDQHYVIVDIGGGSVEFIFYKNNKVLSKRSFPIGIANLYNQFHKSEPIEQQEVKELHSFLCDQIDSYLNDNVSDGLKLIGAAGTFEVFQNRNPQSKQNKISIKELDIYLSELSALTEDERAKSTFIPSDRAKYIVVALILVQHIMNVLQLSHFNVSDYALKEGIIVSG